MPSPSSRVAEPAADAQRRHPGTAGGRVVPSGSVDVRPAPSSTAVASRIVAAGPSYGRPFAPSPDRVGEAPGRRARAVAPAVGCDAAELRRLLVDDTVARLRAATGLAPADRSASRPGPTRGCASSGRVDLADVVAAAGEEAVGYELLRHPYRSALTLDVDALTRCSVDNPFYAVRYAHARAVALLRNAAELGVDKGFEPGGLRAHTVVTGDSAALLDQLTRFPAVVTSAAERLEPRRLTRHLEATANALLRFTTRSPVLPRGDEEPADEHRDATLLVAATRVVLANGLDLLGVRAPDRW